MKLKITVDNKTYEVEVEVAEDDHHASPGAQYYAPQGPVSVPSPVTPPPMPGGAGGEPVADESKVCRSPIAGVVVRINAQPGQQIQTNDPLLVLEAMKMETNITSPVTGKVKQIKTAAGDAVQTGQVLVEFE
jgi:methylmalonyl-CoA carboxyltransferase small subunit